MIDSKDLDTTTQPGDDFYAYANGGWLANNPIPDHQSRWGTFIELQERNETSLRVLLDDLTSDASVIKGGNIDKLRRYYASSQNEAVLNKERLEPLVVDLAAITNIKNVNDIIPVLATLHAYGAQPLWFTFVEPDDKISTEYCLRLYQSGLGLPDREYYLSDSAEFVTIREKYMSHVAAIFVLMGEEIDWANQKAQIVLSLETKLAAASMSRTELRDVERQYNKMTPAELCKTTPNINWSAYLKAIGAPEIKDLLVSQPLFFHEIDSLFASEDLETWKTYLTWHLVATSASKLSDDFVEEHFSFYKKTLSGAAKLQPRWQRALKIIDQNFGEALGELYVNKFFDPEAKRQIGILVDDLLYVFKKHIEQVSWMTEETKQSALRKLSTFATKLGYPDTWRSYDSVAIGDSYVRNFFEANKFEFYRMIGKLGKPIDRAEWFCSAYTVNAFYWSNLNEITFPAGILQSPMFDPKGDMAENYGGIGAVIGHEITHGFDDKGSKFDAEGNMRDWWTDSDRAKFEALAGEIEAQFNGFTVLDTLSVNGKLTLGENIADLGGLAMAYDAYMRALERGGKREVINGFTPEQRFFLAYARVWRENRKPETVRQFIVVDTHAPNEYRANGPLSNTTNFYEAFNVKSDSKLYKDASKRTVIW